MPESYYNCSIKNHLILRWFNEHSRERACLVDFPGCRPGEWQCRDGSCISSSSRCDNILDCIDKSDEEHCPGKFVLFYFFLTFIHE